jgi:Fic family protein
MIVEYIEESLKMVANDEIELPIRASLLHYLLGYIHPFYDGNGRLNRFVSSYLLTKEYEPLIGLRLSYAITRSIDKYYKGFTICNDPLNRGDLTPFVIMFLNIIYQATDEIVQVLAEKEVLYGENSKRLSKIPTIANDKDILELATILLQARMFSGSGITSQGLVGIFRVSRPTVAKRLSRIEEIGILERERTGREVHFQINLDELARISAALVSCVGELRW